jgi:SpoVK/Ycf46/Vps4 family AAA+-type ATPase
MTKEISFDFGAYVEKNAVSLNHRLKKNKSGTPETRRTRRRKILRVASKVASIAREVLDIYSAVKRKDPISIALGALSTYGCVSELFEGKAPQAKEHLKELGAIKAFPMMCAFIFHTLRQMDVSSRRIWNSGENKDEGENTQEGIEEFDLGNGVKVWFISSVTETEGPEDGPYVFDSQKFVKRFSEVVEEKLGKILTIHTITKGWQEFYYLASLRIPTALYICHLDEDALMKRISDLQALGFNRSLLFFGPPGIGKAQPLEALVLTPSGFVEMGKLRLHDQVLTPKGTIAHIIGIFPQGKIDTYTVGFSDGTNTECSLDHLWLTSSVAERNWRKTRQQSVKSLSEIVASLEFGKDRRKNHSIPMVGGRFDFLPQNLPLDPYMLGVLIGEGDFTNATPKVSNTNFGLISSLRRKLDQIDCKLVHIKKGDYRIIKKKHNPKNNGRIDNRSAVAKALSVLGLMGHKADTKFVPDVYKLASYEDRIAILQGILDANGHLTNGSSVIDFSSASVKLALDVRFLVQSLGGKASLSKEPAHYTKDGVRFPAKDKNRLGIVLPPYIIPFRIGYKVKAFKNYASKAKFRSRFIKNISYAGKKESQCIMLNDSDGLYITNDFIITHNTTLAARLAERIGGRLLVASCGTLENSRGRTLLEDLVDIIDPSVVLMDDLDKMWRPSEMLESMENLNRKVSEHKRLLIGTVNSLAEVPEPLRRPGRFDEIVEFCPLTKSQRKIILTTYGKEFGVKYTDREFDMLACKTTEMTGAYLKEIAMRASVMPFDSMCKQIEQMKRICNITEEQEELKEKKGRRRKKLLINEEVSVPRIK